MSRIPKPNKNTGLPKYNGLIPLNKSQQYNKEKLKESLKDQCKRLKKELVK